MLLTISNNLLITPLKFSILLEQHSSNTGLGVLVFFVSNNIKSSIIIAYEIINVHNKTTKNWENI